MSKKALSLELRNAIVWLQRQPEVTSVIQGRYVRTKHHHAVGFTRVLNADAKTIHLRTFDKLGSKELFAYAPPSPLRDRWVAALASGEVFSANGQGPKLAAVLPSTPNGNLKASIIVPTPKPINAEAGQLFEVTPELAAKWLERNTRNRALRENVVQKYAGDMKAGRWMVTGDAIAFDKNGAIVNGQHRLWAVIYAEMTVPMLATFNLEPDVVRVLDDHLKRGLTDVVKIAKPGTNITQKFSSISRVMQMASIALAVIDKRMTLARLSRQQQILFMEKHEAAIYFTIHDCFKSTNIRGLTPAIVIGSVARAYYSQDHERLKQFAKVLTSGIPEDPREDRAALVLRNWLMRPAHSRTTSNTEVIYRKTQRALMAFCKREHLKTLYEAPEELFFLPEDKAPKKAKTGENR